MATRLIALLRGINVGKAKRIAMADVRALFADLGFTEVATLLNSGNVVFTAEKVVGAAARLEFANEKELPLTRSDWADERMAVARRAACLWCPAGSQDTKSNAAVGKLFGTAITSRYGATILKLQALVADVPAK